jgi:hypothetical protein
MRGGLGDGGALEEKTTITATVCHLICSVLEKDERSLPAPMNSAQAVEMHAGCMILRFREAFLQCCLFNGDDNKEREVG